MKKQDLIALLYKRRLEH